MKKLCQEFFNFYAKNKKYFFALRDSASALTRRGRVDIVSRTGARSRETKENKK